MGITYINMPSIRFIQSMFWMFMMCSLSNLNDIIMKILGDQLPVEEIAFFRFFFSTILLLPFTLLSGKKLFATNYPAIQLARGILLFVAITSWCYGVYALPLTTTTTIGFTTPLFILPFAKIFLNEDVSPQRWLAALIGFVGIIVVIHPHDNKVNPFTFLLLLSVIIFALLDILNKRMMSKNEPFLPMLFFSAFITTILGCIPAYLVWKTPTIEQISYLVILGAGANLTLYSLLKAYKLVDVSAVQPFRYFEIILSMIFGVLIFNEALNFYTLSGGLIIICATFYILFYESQPRQVLSSEL